MKRTRLDADPEPPPPPPLSPPELHGPATTTTTRRTAEMTAAPQQQTRVVKCSLEAPSVCTRTCARAARRGGRAHAPHRDRSLPLDAPAPARARRGGGGGGAVSARMCDREQSEDTSSGSDEEEARWSRATASSSSSTRCASVARGRERIDADIVWRCAMMATTCRCGARRAWRSSRARGPAGQRAAGGGHSTRGGLDPDEPS